MTTTHTIEKLLRQQAALAHFGSFAFRESDLQTILSEAARICAQSLGVPFSKICCYRPLQNDLLVVAGYGWEPASSAMSHPRPTKVPRRAGRSSRANP